MTVKIVHISDLHIEPEPERRFPGIMSRLAVDQEKIKRLNADLVVATGDLTNFGSSRVEDLRLARDWLDGLDTPYLAVPGNHDLGPARHRQRRNPESEAYHDGDYATSGYASLFGASPVSRHDMPGLTLIGLALREDDPDDALERLRQELAASSGPIIVAGHYPVVATRELEFSIEFGTDDLLPRAIERLRTLLENDDRVIAYLCGHVHITSLRQIGAGCVQLTAGGLGPGSSSYRVYEFDGDHLRYKTVDGAGPAIFWERTFQAPRGFPDFSSGRPRERAGTLTMDGVVS